MLHIVFSCMLFTKPCCVKVLIQACKKKEKKSTIYFIEFVQRARRGFSA